jgi:hypothetical protein
MNPLNMQSMSSIVDEMAKVMAENAEERLTEDLNDLVKRNLLIIERGPVTCIKDPLTYKIKIVQSVRLVLKDKEYIAKLEKENLKLKAKINNLQDFFKSDKENE